MKLTSIRIIFNNYPNIQVFCKLVCHSKNGFQLVEYNNIKNKIIFLNNI